MSKRLMPSDILYGQQISLRVPRIEELSFIRMLWGDSETMAAVGGPIDWTETQFGNWYTRMIDPGDLTNCYCLIFDGDDNPIGEISFHRWNSEKRSAELNVKILASKRNLGYGMDALNTFLKFFFGRVAALRMTDDVAMSNTSGQRLLELMGFEKMNCVSNTCRMVMTRQMYMKQYE